MRHEKSKTGKQPASHYHVQSDADSEQHLHLMKPPDDKDSAKESSAPSPFVSVWNKVSNSAKGKCRKPAPQAWNRDVLGQMSKIREHMTEKPKNAPAFCCDWMGDSPPATSQVALEPLDAVNVLAFSAVGREYAQHTRFRTLLHEGVAAGVSAGSYAKAGYDKCTELDHLCRVDVAANASRHRSELNVADAPPARATEAQLAGERSQVEAATLSRASHLEKTRKEQQAELT